MSVAVVTDSTSSLPIEYAELVTIVPLTVVLGDRHGREGAEIVTGDVLRALASERPEVTTSRPPPADFAAVYRRLLAGGASGVLSIHLSARLSGTVAAATLAAREFGGWVAVLDARSAGMGLGFCALAALAAADKGDDLAGVRAAAASAIDDTTALFCVDTLDHLRRGGRIGSAAALLGSALAVKPILSLREGGVVVVERVRTLARALARMTDLAVDNAGTGRVDLATHHAGAPDRAEALLAAVAGRLGDRVRTAWVTDLSAVAVAHVGPGAVSVVIHRVG